MLRFRPVREGGRREAKQRELAAEARLVDEQGTLSQKKDCFATLKEKDRFQEQSRL